MDKNIAKEYYSRNDIQKVLLNFSNSREIAVQYEGFYGKRPDVIEYLSDIKNFVKKDAFSFHSSEERWLNPLLLGDKKLTPQEREDNRIGWDLILDLDGVDFLFAKITGKIIIEFLTELGIKNISTKFSGNKGFHIGIPFEAFSEKIIGIGETRTLFPDVARKIAFYLMEELKGKISKAILNEYSNSIEKIASKYGFKKEDLIIDDKSSNNLNYIKLIEIDTILISTRHLFRMPYSLNEKSGLASIPVKNENIMDFEKFLAKPNRVKPENYKDFEFLKYQSKYGKDADILLLKAFEEVNDDDVLKIATQIEKERKGQKRGIIFTGDVSGEVFEINGEVEIKDFPKTISFILNNQFEDGKKRAIFVLLTFLNSIKWNHETIKVMLKEWNEKQPNPLKNNYIESQFNWFKSINKIISPPNFINNSYYKSIGIPEKLILEDITKFKTLKIKNPLHYIYILLKKNEKKNKELNK